MTLPVAVAPPVEVRVGVEAVEPALATVGGRSVAVVAKLALAASPWLSVADTDRVAVPACTWV